MTWRCINCKNKNGDYMKWCDWCDQAERVCTDCSSTFEWEEDGFTVLRCNGCSKVISI